jgi:hypothetical protein
MFEVDTALGCLLGFYMGNGIQANSGRVYKWCPFWGKMGTESHLSPGRTIITPSLEFQ